jgi:hypothetical protein
MFPRSHFSAEASSVKSCGEWIRLRGGPRRGGRFLLDIALALYINRF